MPDSAVYRGGVQPVVHVSVDGGRRVDISTGAGAAMKVTAEALPGAGKIVRIQWAMDGDGTYEIDEVAEPSSQLTLERRHTYADPGTPFVTVRVSTQRDADPETLFARVDNLARARIAVR
ncbi:hypothetical protein [Streptomyces sp. NPDC048438]|uniref:hypothetical protein n=1 Tax=Streptomyces sp. NPDC048438 TaxID=3365551 RepID=UPI0037192F05